MIQNHLKHLMYNDCYSMRVHGANHNAMDRSCVLDQWLEDIASPYFVDRFNESKKRYTELRQKFKEDNFQCENPQEDEIESYADEIAANWKKYVAAAVNR